jgi:hypothetical protein
MGLLHGRVTGLCHLSVEQTPWLGSTLRSGKVERIDHTLASEWAKGERETVASHAATRELEALLASP